MSIARFAGAVLKRAVLPRGAGQIAMEFLPDALGTGFTMMSLPEGTSLQDRLLVGAEDLTLGVGGSLGGRFVGGMAGGLLHQRGKGGILGGVQRAHTIRSGAGIGGMAGGMGLAMFGPRPIYDGIQQRLQQQAQQQQDAQMQGVFEQGLMAGASQIAQGPRISGIDNMLAGFY